MILLGLLAVLQVVWLPGYLIVTACKIQGGLLRKALISFGISLVANYALIFFLVIIRIYLQWVMLVVIGIEILALLWIKRAALTSKIYDSSERLLGTVVPFFRSLLPEKEKNKERHPGLVILKSAFIILAVLLAGMSMAWLLYLFVRNLGTVFNSWDAVVSWNKWAVEWAGNAIPIHTWRYAQLIPINWSITYVLMGTTRVQFFAKAIMPLFSLGIVLTFIDLGFAKRKWGYFLAAFLSFLLIKHFLGEYIVEGYVDIPTAFLSLLAVYMLIDLDVKDRMRWPEFLIGAVFAGGAAACKQTGLYMAAAYPFLVFLRSLKKDLKISWVDRMRWLLFIVLIVVLLAAPWYFYKQYTFAIGSDEPESQIVTSVTQETFDTSNIFIRMVAAFSSLGSYLIFFLVCIPLFLFLERDLLWTGLVIVVPYVLLWAFFLGYDARNLALALPFVALVIGVAAANLVNGILHWLQNRNIWHLQWFWVIIVITLLAAPLLILLPAQKLANRQDFYQRQIFAPSLNESLYDYLEQTDTVGEKILTNYPVRFLPGMEAAQVEFWFDDAAVFSSVVKDPAIRYILMPAYANQEIKDAILEKIATGEYKFIFEDSTWIDYVLFEIPLVQP